MLKRKNEHVDDFIVKRSRIEVDQDKKRPNVPKLSPQSEHFIFQEIEIDHYLSLPITSGVDSKGSVPILRIFGSTKEGNSVCCHVHGFYPYFLIEMPTNFKCDDLPLFEKNLNEAVICDMRSNKENIVKAVIRIELLKGRSLYGYSGKDMSLFAKIFVIVPKLVAPAKRIVGTVDLHPLVRPSAVRVFEANVDIEMRFLFALNASLSIFVYAFRTFIAS